MYYAAILNLKKLKGKKKKNVHLSIIEENKEKSKQKIRYSNCLQIGETKLSISSSKPHQTKSQLHSNMA